MKLVSLDIHSRYSPSFLPKAGGAEATQISQTTCASPWMQLLLPLLLSRIWLHHLQHFLLQLLALALHKHHMLDKLFACCHCCAPGKSRR